MIAVRGTTFYAAWAEQLGTTEFTQDIYFSRSTNDGVSWSAPTRVDLGDNLNAHDSDLPKIAVTDTGIVGVIWEETRDAFQQQSTNDDIFFNRSVDGGVTWQPVSIALNTGTAGAHVTSDIDRMWLCATGNTFHVTWEEDSLTSLGGNEELWYTRSTDGGQTWSTPVTLNANPGGEDVDEPKVEADGNLVFVTYVDSNDDVIGVRSIDGGATFSAPVRIESDPNGNADEPTLKVKGNVIVVAWTEQDPGTASGEGVHCCVSVDGGLTWRPEVTLSERMLTVTGADADAPVIAIQSANNFIVSYPEDSVWVAGGGATGGSRNECLVAYTTNGGLTWTKDVGLYPGVVTNRPYVVATPNAVVAWLELNPNGSNIGAFCHSPDGGATWTTPAIVNNTGPDVDEGCATDEGIYVAMSPLSNTVHVTHMDRPLGQNEVYTSGYLVTAGVGTNYCTARPNSTGQTAAMSAGGSRFVVNNDVRLIATELPPNAFGFFLTSRNQGLIANPGGSQGNLCLTGSIGRYVGPGQIKNSGAQGRIELQINLNAHPTPSGLIQVVAGEVWNFTAWYRDSVSGVATSNFADGLQVFFQ